MAQIMPLKPLSTPILLNLDEKKRTPLTPQDTSPWGHTDGSFAFYPDTPPLSSSSSDTGFAIGQSLYHSTQVSQHDEPVIAVIGVGYVGTHLVSSFSSRYQVIGFDVSAKKVKDLSAEYQDTHHVSFSRDSQDLRRATHFLISVPTLLRPDKTIDSSYLREALKTVGEVARSGSTVIIESSVAVGMTRQLLGPLAASRTFFAGMSPERVDPGRVEPPVQTIPKIISGLDDITPGSLDAIHRVYSTIFDTVVPVSKPEVAEMMKLYENCQRMVCIAYANEMADACVPHGIDPYEVCEAASTKPFGYMPYAPGVGVGGHCIPVNPFYLLSNSHFPLLECATRAMHSRPSSLAERMLKTLRQRITHRTPRVLVVGVGFKAGQSQVDNSPGAELVKSLAVSREVDACWADALVKQAAFPQVRRLPNEDWQVDVLAKFDIIVVASRQPGMDFDILDELEGVQIERWCQ
ncbi:related to Vi polysaccharide biosynthesis protein vipA/tviB [Fusarium torulosum]|uniref:Related to Vi polysaccharide biosynthesis protein vipA/tviB n=1 Tax=Fusarium torulosum TaxID=33205 RepID=A0AAE8ME96_9HYPO|nr:related to Vi polysaccharide biosynthesis protein vipA/tviB [Fusarium torulosum]